MHLKKKNQNYNLASSLRPAAACELDRTERGHIQKMLFTSQTLGPYLHSLPARGRKVFLPIKSVWLQCNKYLSGDLRKGVLYKELLKNLSEMPHGPVVTLEPYIYSRKLCNCSLYILPYLCYIFVPLKLGERQHCRSVAEELSSIQVIAKDQLWLSSLEFKRLSRINLWVPVCLLFSCLSRLPGIQKQQVRNNREKMPQVQTALYISTDT